MPRRLAGVVIAGALLAALLPGSAAAVDPAKRPATPLPAQAEQLKLDQPITLTGGEAAAKIDKLLRGASGTQRVFVRLSAEPSVVKVDAGAAEQRAAYGIARAQQAKVIAEAKKADPKATVLGRTGKASNVVAMKIDAKALATLARDRSVVAIVPVKDYSLDLSATVPYVGGTTVQKAGWKGQGVDVAVLDSGIDYTHVAFGGLGTEAAFKAAYGESTDDPKNTLPDGFPTSRIKGGYDFVGEAWPTFGDEAPDPDPIDSPDSGTALGIAMGTDGGHGTHVADIIGGTKGMAPRANLYAVKVCSSISTSCSGIALIQAMDWAIDPNGDGYLTDHVDIINMSLGSDYGTVADDDLSLAVERATHYAGILTVAASGNGANKPYVSGTPAAAPSALSVAQTQVPGARTYPLVINSPASIAGTYKNTETVEWAPLGTGFTGDVAFVGRGCPADSIEPGSPEDAYLTSPAGKVALIDRGACSISLKVDRAAKAGATAVLLGLVAPGDAVSFSYGGGDTFVPTMVITQDTATAIKNVLDDPQTVNVTVSNATYVSLVGSMAGTSSRGPSSANRIKPEIGAPGASVSAVSGSGNGTQAFGGTSGATPMVTGAAALLKSAFPKRSALEIKAVLMNTAETTVYTNPAIQPGVLAPITRIGGGELRVSRALKAPIAVWDSSGQSGSLSFGFVDGSRTVTVSKRLTVRNYTTQTLTYYIKPTFRYANDKSNAAVKITAPTSVKLTSKQTKTITVTATIYGSKLRDWTMNGGPDGINPAALDLMEYDGYINFDRAGTSTDNADPIHVAWHVLPRKSGNVTATPTSIPADSLVTLSNTGVGPAAIETYSLVGTSPDKPLARPGMNSPVIDLKAVGVQTYPVDAGYCGPASPESFVYTIAVSTWERQTTAVVPGEIDVNLDVNDDGAADYLVFSSTASLTLSDARAVTYVYNYDTEDLSAYFYTDHGTNDSNLVMWLCGDQIGMDATDFGAPMTMDVAAYDWYYHDYALTDSITGIEVAPYAEHFWTGGGILPSGVSADLLVEDLAGYYAYPANPSETGLLITTNGLLDYDGVTTWRAGAPNGREAIQLTVTTP